MSTQRTPLPVSFFSMAVGTLAWGQSWQAAALVWPLPTWVVTLASSLGVVVWLVLLTAYVYKTWAAPQAMREEFKHPVHSAMTALLPVFSMLAAITLKPWRPELAHGLLILALLAQLFLGVWLTGRFWQGGRAPESINASVYLPSVAQNFVAATACASFGYPTLAGLLFGAGVFSWLALDSMITGRAATLPALEPEQRPLQGIQLAPPVVGGLSYLALSTGPPDMWAQMLLGYGLYQGLLAIRQLPWTLQTAFAPSYWAFSFGVMAMASMGWRMWARAPDEVLWQMLAPVLFGVANGVFGLLLWHTTRLGIQGRLLPNLNKAKG
jgi:tellurite resistance protein